MSVPVEFGLLPFFGEHPFPKHGYLKSAAGRPISGHLDVGGQENLVTVLLPASTCLQTNECPRIFLTAPHDWHTRNFVLRNWVKELREDIIAMMLGLGHW